MNLNNVSSTISNNLLRRLGVDLELKTTITDKATIKIFPLQYLL